MVIQDTGSQWIMEKALVYLFEGEEEFLKEEELKRLERELLSEGTKDLNITTFFGQDADGPTIVSQLRTLPALSPKRLVIVKDAELLSPSGRDSLISYIKAPQESACLILEARKIEKGDPLYQAVARFGRIASFSKLYDEKLDRWIGARIRTYGKRISPRAVAVLRENIGSDLRSLAQALEKIASYVGERADVSLKDVEEVVAKSARYRIFDLTDAIGRKDKARALEVISRLIQDGRREPEIVGMLFWQLGRIRTAKVLLAQGTSKERVGRDLNVHNFFLDDFIAQTQNFRAEELDEDFELLLEAEKDCKLGSMREDVALELLVVRLCG